MPIRIVANFVDGTEFLTGNLNRSGHLQLVFGDEEMEAQGVSVIRVFGSDSCLA